MEDIIRALLDVVRAQHSAAEGTDEAPFDMNDIVDMAMNIVGRPDESEEVAEMVDSIQRLVETLAPDIFPPKPFEEMDDTEQAASVASMIEERLRRGMTGRRAASENSAMEQQAENTHMEQAAENSREEGIQENEDNADAGMHGSGASQEPARPEETEDSYETPAQEAVPDSADSFDAQQTAELNDLIYKNLMEMMGMQNPQVEYPFDLSQIQYGREKSVTEMLEEERQEEERLKEESRQREEALQNTARTMNRNQTVQQETENHPRSAWELAQDAIDRDEQAHEKEPYIPQVLDDEPATKSASQLAAEAIRRSQEEDREKLEIEKQAERLMEEAKKRGQDPMKFALHQQEILRYMEKNSDELVSFEDYEDLSPEEKYEIERQLHIEKQLADGVHPDEVDDQVPEEFIPEELKAAMTDAREAGAGANSGAGDNENEAETSPKESVGETPSAPVLTEDMLRQLSQEVIRENSEMILSENENEDMDSLNDLIMENIKNMMSGSGAAVPQENVGDLLAQAAAAAKGETESGAASGSGTEKESAQAPGKESEEPLRGLSAVELAKAAQRAAKPEPQEVKEGKSAVELAKEAQENARKARAAEESAGAGSGAASRGPESKGQEEQDYNLQHQEQDQAEADERVSDIDSEEAIKGEIAQSQTIPHEDEVLSETENNTEEKGEEMDSADSDAAEDDKSVQQPDEAAAEAAAGESEPDPAVQEEEPEEEYEYVDPDELVLGEHTQAEIDEALDNLNSLGLEGEVYERAKRMLLLELAGSEGELDAWLREQESGKKKKATVSALDGEEDSLDLDDLDEDMLEKELELAMDEDFLVDDDEEDAGSVDDEPEDEESGNEELAHEEYTEEETGEDEESAEDEPAQESSPEEREDMSADVISEVEVEDTVPIPEADRRHSAINRTARASVSRKKVVKRREKKAAEGAAPGKTAGEAARTTADGTGKTTGEKAAGEGIWTDQAGPAEKREYQVSLRHPFVLKNSASFMDQFEKYIADTQENRKLSTGFKKLDAMLRYGLHKGTYFIDSKPQYLKNSFMQQMADRAAESGVDVLYISTELSRYDLMVDTISRLSYEIHQGDPDKAVSVMSIMTGEDGADLESLKDELNWYRGRISEHLYILDQEVVAEYTDAMEDASAGDILGELIRSIVRDGVHKPVVFIDNIENILSVEDTEDIKPLMEGIRRLAGELGIPIIMSYGYAQAESETEMSGEESRFHELLGNMCDVYMELQYADMITEDSVEITEEDIEEMVEEGDSLLINVLLHRNRRPLRASCQIQGTPKFNYFEE